MAKLKKAGSKLHGPLAGLPINLLDWPRDLLPEHLWIAALAEYLGLDQFHHGYNAFLDALDPHWPSSSKDVCYGIITDFGLVEEEQRLSFLEQNRELVEDLFWSPIGPSLSLYPDCPAAWLVAGSRPPDHEHVDPDASLAKLRHLVSRLFSGRDDFASRVRLVPLTRPLKHGKLHFMQGMETVDLLPRYPNRLSSEEKLRVESFVRSTMNTQLMMREHLQEHVWPQHFWRQNANLAVCRPLERHVPSGALLTDAEDIEELERRLREASSEAREYLSGLTHKISIDLYEPIRDEVLFGLFSRITRLFCLLLDDPQLWARDVAGIVVRCLADSVITFAYLVKKGSLKDFEAFVQYGEGQQKLLMLHLQDNYPDDVSPEGLSADELAHRFGVMPEFIDIELGHWAKSDTRTIAKKAGLADLYSLVFSPTSGDIHGSWLSLKNSNLTVCEEPLHRNHRLPSYAEPPFLVFVSEVGRRLYTAARAIAVGELSYPEPDAEILPFVVEPDISDENGDEKQAEDGGA